MSVIETDEFLIFSVRIPSLLRKAERGIVVPSLGRKGRRKGFPIDGIGNRWYNFNQLNLWVSYWEKKSRCRRIGTVYRRHPDFVPIPNPPVFGKKNTTAVNWGALSERKGSSGFLLCTKVPGNRQERGSIIFC